jgi:hypothetical protein
MRNQANPNYLFVPRMVARLTLRGSLNYDLSKRLFWLRPCDAADNDTAND